MNGKSITGDEMVFPFRPSFLSRRHFLLRRRRQDPAPPPERRGQTIPFTAALEVTPVAGTYPRKKRDFDSQTPRKALGIVRPVISPDGKTIAFNALGDIYLMPVGGAPVNITHDAAYDCDPAWSPDGSQLVYCSDKAGGLLQLWLRDMKTGRERQLTHLSTQPISPTFSPDGKRIAYLDVDGMWRRASIAVLDVASGRDPSGACLDLRARRAHLVAGRQAHRGGDGGALFHPLPRRHQPGADHVVHRHARSQRRQMVCAGAGSFHRRARLERAGLVARRHPHGRRSMKAL